MWISNPSHKIPDHKLRDEMIFLILKALTSHMNQQQVRANIQEMQKCTWVPAVFSK